VKKVVCPSCGLVNLEKFVTFPFCAACGGHLPEKEPSKLWSILSQPVKPAYWVLSVGFGLAILAVSAIGIVVETRDRSDKSLLIYAQIPRRVSEDGLIYSSFTLDSIEEYPASTFSDVRLRFTQETLKRFEVVAFVPPPIKRENYGSAKYYFWPKLKRSEAVKIVLAPKTTGELPFRYMVYARGHIPLQARNSISVTRDDLARRASVRKNK
jgi:hypothetical protein